MRRAQGRRDRPHLNAQRVRDRAVVEVGVVAQIDSQPLPLRQRGHPWANPGLVRLSIRRRNLGSLGSLAPRRSATASSQSSVHNDAPYPRLQRPLTAKRLLLTQRLREAVLHRIVPARLVTNDGCCYAQEVAVTPPIEVFKLASDRPTRCHHPNDAREAPVCLVLGIVLPESVPRVDVAVFPSLPRSIGFRVCQTARRRTRRVRGPSNSQRKIRCRPPSARSPFSSGIVMELAVSVERACDQGFWSPSLVCCQGQVSSTRRSKVASMSVATRRASGPLA